MCLPKHLIGDHKRIQQVAANLIFNAIQSTRNFGHVDVFVAYDHEDEKILFAISDNGRGMSQNQ